MVQGTAGIEPATAGSAIPCSTAELCTRAGRQSKPVSCTVSSLRPKKETHETKKKIHWGRAGIEPATSRTRSENHTTRPTALRQAAAWFTPAVCESQDTVHFIVTCRQAPMA